MAQKKKSNFSVSEVSEVESGQRSEEGDSWRSEADLLAVRWYRKSSAKVPQYRDTLKTAQVIIHCVSRKWRRSGEKYFWIIIHAGWIVTKNKEKIPRMLLPARPSDDAGFMESLQSCCCWRLRRSADWLLARVASSESCWQNACNFKN